MWSAEWGDIVSTLGNDPGVVVKTDEPLSAHTSLRLGGPAAVWVEPVDAESTARTIERLGTANRCWMPLGAGTNVLFPDAGFDGVVLSLRRLNTMAVADNEVTADAGILLNRVVRRVIDAGLAGLEELVDIPGTVGGAVAGNAGAGSQAVCDHLSRVRIAERDGGIVWVDGSSLHPTYRSIELETGSVILAACWVFPHSRPALLQQRASAASRRRRNTQPWGVPTAGCVFKNPDGQSAGRLIDQAGLKGTRVGGAVVSHHHANFIVIDGPAKADGVKRLIEVVAARVYSAFGVKLELELVVVGERME